jgi:GNAT superfamily N-acetyltransferase
LDEATADETIDKEIAYFKRLGLADHFEWKVFGYDAPADLKDRLAARGFVAEDPDAVLILDLSAIPQALVQPVTHDVRRLTDPDQLGDVRTVLDAVWEGEDHGWIVNMMGATLRDKPEQVSVYAAYIKDVPVSAAWIDFHERSDFAGLWGGSTLPAYRQRGLYTALVAARAQEAIRRGMRYLTIDASPMSRAVLEKFGFRLMTYAYECNYRGE